MYESDPRIKKMSDKGKELLAWMANSLEENGGAWLDKDNVEFLTSHAIDQIVKKLNKLTDLPDDKLVEKNLVIQELCQCTECNGTGGYFDEEAALHNVQCEDPDCGCSYPEPCEDCGGKGIRI
jgi:hypothetical protein